MTDDLRTRLAASVDLADEDVLAPHARRGALFFVDPSLDLVDVGLAVATDRASLVSFWVESGLLRRADPGTFQPAGAARHRALIVQPFVLVQPGGIG